jgi:hypothetical protein
VAEGTGGTEQSLFVILKDMERIQDESRKLCAKIGVLQEMHVSRLMEREYATPPHSWHAATAARAATPPTALETQAAWRPCLPFPGKMC